MLKFEDKKSNVEPDPMPVFEYNGTTYTVDANQPPGRLAQYFVKLEQDGDFIATVWYNHQILGDGYEVLLAIPGITTDEISETVALAQNIAFGLVVPGEPDKSDSPLASEAGKSEDAPVAPKKSAKK